MVRFLDARCIMLLKYKQKKNKYFFRLICVGFWYKI